MADYFFPSIEDGRTLSSLDKPEEILDWAHRLGAKTVFLKLGPEGAVVSDGAKRERIPGLAVKALDATGAGDCFCGAALARLAAGDSIWDAARYANAAAALATRCNPQNRCWRLDTRGDLIEGNSFASVPRNARACGVFRFGERCFSSQ